MIMKKELMICLASLCKGHFYFTGKIFSENKIFSKAIRRKNEEEICKGNIRFDSIDNGT